MFVKPYKNKNQCSLATELRTSVENDWWWIFPRKYMARVPVEGDLGDGGHGAVGSNLEEVLVLLLPSQVLSSLRSVQLK